MTVVKMPLVNVSPPVSANVCRGNRSDADGEGEQGEGSKWYFLRTFFMDEPVSRNLSQDLSRKNAKP